MHRAAHLAAAGFCLALLAACGGSTYGNAGNFKNIKNNGSASIFEAAPSPSSAAAIGEGQGPTPPPKVGSGSTQQQQQQRAAPQFPIKIESDTSSTPGFVPAQAQVYKGTIIVWTNTDTKPRSVVSAAADPAAFNSGLIAPGASWSWTATVNGTFGYSDGTRPYQQGSFAVINR
jgi:plastocyanin